MTEQATEVKRCRAGINTDSPCPFVATETSPFYGTDEPAMCAYHAADDALYDEIDEYGVALDIIEGVLRETHENYVLRGDLERLKKDYQERLNFFQAVADDFKAANKKVTIYMGR